ncbi:MAG: hypothetical protein LBI28_04285 [Treponema sp.]|jgi:hypothetical protein|nr:hypothetical protein [Treponema sp.]
MNKIMVFFILILFSTNSFSQEERNGSFEFFAGMPFYSGSIEHDGTETIKFDLPFSFGMGAANYNVFPNKNIGLIFSGSFIFPKALLHTVGDREIRYEGNNFWGMDVQFGIGYYLFKTGNFRFPLTVGLHFLFLGGTSTPSSVETHELAKASVGLCASIAAELHINSTVYFFARLHGSFDFLTSTTHTVYTGVNVAGRMAYFIDGRDFTEFSKYFGFTPAIGFGLKMDGLSVKQNNNE